MIQTYPNYLNQYQIIGIGDTVDYSGIYTEIVINEYDITVDNSIQALSIYNGVPDLQIDNDMPELYIR